MQNLFFALGMMVPLFASGIAQGQNEEMTRLRAQLGLAAKTIIRSGPGPTLPEVTPLKIYITSEPDKRSASNLRGWIAKWNKESGKKFGIVQEVEGLAAADVVLARFTLKKGHIATYGAVDEVAGRITVAPTWLVPYYSYILSKRGDAFEILWRGTGELPYVESEDGGQTLRDAFFKMLRRRAKSTARKGS